VDRYFDRQGNPLSLGEWSKLHADRDYSIIKQTTTDRKLVSTVWLGLNHRFGHGEPLIFETMVFLIDKNGDIDYGDIDSERYSTEEEALAGHELMCENHAGVLDRIVKKLEEEDEAVEHPDRERGPQD